MEVLKVNGMFLDFEVLDVVLAVLLCYSDYFFVLFAFLERNDVVTAVVTFGLPDLIEEFEDRGD